MAFEQNQQDQFNMNNGIDQLKQFKAELDKATASIGAAELEAEEELLGIRLKNLSKAQQTKLTQLGQMLELEEKGIQELAKLKLTLSNRQFAVRKKEIQKEFQEYKTAADEFFKADSKRKATKASTSKPTDDLKASSKSTKATDAAIQKASKKVQSAIYGVSKLSQEINETIVSLQEATSATKDLQTTAKEQKQSRITSATSSESKGAGATKPNVNPSVNTADEQKPAEQKPSTTKRAYNDDSNGLKKVDLGEYSAQKVFSLFDGLRNDLEKDPKNKSILTDLNKVMATMTEKKDKAGNVIHESNASQTTLDITGVLLDSIAKANDKEAELQEFRKDAETLALNRRILALTQEQETRKKYLDEYEQLQADSFSHLVENMSAEAYAALKAETEATEKAIAARSKTSEASEKALATLKGKGTLAEKKQLLEAQVKERAAQKDWSQAGEKFQITDDMSEEEKAEAQKARERAAALEMAANAAMNAMADFAKQLNKQTDQIGAKQAPIDTRLQGSSANDTILGSYWKRLARDMNYVGAVNPYFKQEDFANNIETLVNKGISFDIKQRAFLMTIQEKIANTFDVADGTLLRLIRIQQQDTTAGRLGMESALNSFLNSMYETSEYLTDVAASVRGSLEEMQALMEGAAGTELEFQIQKWMGSLYSVGMSQDAVQSIARTFGQIASGEIEGIAGGGTGNLLIMAANEAGMSIADILQDGLNADETNKLMQAMVNYLAEIASSSSDSRVVQQQLANVFGVKASDLRAATNLASSIKDVSNQDLTYSRMLGQLNKMANSMILRTSTGEMLSNVWSNVNYTMATQMSNDPILYLLPRVATLLEDYAGGIDLPFLNVMGFGVDLNTSVAQLMNVAALSGSILGALGPMITGLGSAVSGSAMLNLAGINTSGKAPVIARGSAQPLQNLGGSSISESGLVGNGSGDDVKNATLQGAEDDKKKQMVEAKEDESDSDLITKSQQAVIDIYNLLEEVVHGSLSLRVRLVTSNNGFFETDNGNWVLSI